MIQIKKRLPIIFAGAAILLAAILFSCNPQDDLGSELTNQDWLNLKGTDTFHLQCSIAKKDSVKTFNNLSTLLNYRTLSRSFPVGKIDDPFFGKMSSGFVTQLSFVPQKDTSFLTRPIDSIVLYIIYDSLLFYGKWNDPMSVSLHYLDEQLSGNITYYDSYSPILGKKIAELNDFIPNIRDTLKLKFGSDTTFIAIPPSLRIPLDTGAFMTLLRGIPDTAFQKISDFKMKFNGIAMLVEKANGFISLQLENLNSKISIYYKKDTIPAVFNFNMADAQVKTPFYKSENQSYPVADYLSGQIPCDSLMFIESFIGRDARVKINHNPDWEKKFINYAALEFYAAALPGDNTQIFSLPSNLQLYDYSTDVRLSVEDVITNLLSGSSALSALERNFGGTPVKVNIQGTDYYQYKMNITRYFIGKVRSKKALDLIISNLYKLESPARVIIHGNNNPLLRPKLHVKFSE